MKKISTLLLIIFTISSPLAYADIAISCDKNYFDIAEAMHEEGELNISFKMYKKSYKCAKTKKQKIKSLASLAVTSFELEKKEQSKKYLKEILQISPTNKWANAYLKNKHSVEKKGKVSPLLNKIFTFDMIGVNLPYLENMIGPAKRSFEDGKNSKSNTYMVDGCEVTAKIANNTVQALGVDRLDNKCTFEVSNMLPNYDELPLAHKLKFGQLSGGIYTADCLRSCGNAYDPSIYFNWLGSRADGLFQVQLGALQVSDSILNAADKWEDSMIKREGENWVVDGKFACTDKYNSIAEKLFANERITSIYIGFDLFELDPKDCN